MASPHTPPEPGPPKQPATSSCATTISWPGRRHSCGTGGSQFIDVFDEIFHTEGYRVFKTPVRTPVANALAERWIGTLRRELLDRTLIWNRRQLERLVIDYIDHYNTHRPHRSLDQRPPAHGVAEPTATHHLQVLKSSRCDRLINEYRNAA